MIFTRQLLKEYTNGGRLTKRQSEILNIGFPMTLDVLDSILGREIADDVFEAFKDAHRPSKRLLDDVSEDLQDGIEWDKVIYPQIRHKWLMGWKGCFCGYCLRKKWDER